jgi:GNAT superfamily N-acetyltransferase
MPSRSAVEDRLALARRLERAEASACAAYVDARRAVQPGAGAEWIEVGGAYAMFDGVGSPLTQSFGIGLFEPFREAELERVERFFRQHDSDTFHEVCELADPACGALLEPRGYVRIEASTVMIRPTAGGPTHLSGEITVRHIAPGEERDWAEVAARGWSTESPDLAGFVRDLGLVMSHATGSHCFFAELSGRPIASGGLNLAGGVALLAGASTILEARGRGAQSALLSARLAFAAERGADLAMVVTQPGSASARNAERRGFRTAYSRSKWQRERSIPG